MGYTSVFDINETTGKGELVSINFHTNDIILAEGRMYEIDPDLGKLHITLGNNFIIETLKRWEL